MAAGTRTLLIYCALTLGPATASPFARAAFPQCPPRSPNGCYCRQSPWPQMVCTGLDSFPQFDTDSYGIHSLDLSRNVFGNSSVILPPFTNLRRLVLNHNDLTSLDHWQLGAAAATLEYLSINHNTLTSIPGVIRSLPNLDSLDLSHNNITLLQWDAFQNNVYLRDLYLDHNPITRMNSTLTLSSLRTLYMAPPPKSSVTDIPEFPMLRSLALFGNTIDFRNSEHWFMALGQLRHLAYSSESNVTQDEGVVLIPTQVLSSQLTHLSLASNSLTSSRSIWRWLGSFTALQGLDLSWNDLDSYDLSVMREMPELIELDLEGNSLRSVKHGLLTELHNLRLLNLRNNGLWKIHGLNGRVGHISPNLLLLLAGNPWRCSCHLEWLAQLMERQRQGLSWHLEPHEMYHEITCEAPANLEGVLVNDVPMEDFNC